MAWIIYAWIYFTFSQEYLSANTCKTCNNMRMCNCSALAFKTVPIIWIPEVVHLDLSYNHIKVIEEMDFNKYKQLKKLFLQNNMIQSIHENAFNLLKELTHLDLSNNFLSDLTPAWFSSLLSLQYFNILGNHYSSFGPGKLFARLRNLKHLKCGNPALDLVKTVDFDGLSSVDELEFMSSNLQLYEKGSFGIIGNITHFIITEKMSNKIILSEIISDLRENTIWFEMRNMSLSNDLDITDLPSFSDYRLEKMSFKHVTFTVINLVTVSSKMTGSSVTELEAEDCILNGNGQWDYSPLVISVRKITVKNLFITHFQKFPSLEYIGAALNFLENVTIINSMIFLLPCNIVKLFKQLKYLDLSDNLLGDRALEEFVCEGAFPSLRVLNISRNYLHSFPAITAMSVAISTLTVLDVSHNNLDDLPKNCTWSPHLIALNLSATSLKRLTMCIPQTLQILDVSNNQLSNFNLNLPHLRQLYLSKNNLMNIPDASSFPNLYILKISFNKLSTIQKESFLALRKLKSLEAGNNKYVCSCEFLSFASNHNGFTTKLIGWPEEYKCDSPDALRDTLVQKAALSLLECHRQLTISVMCIVIFLSIITMVTLCYKYHGLWYIRMIWAWLQAKRKPSKIVNKEICYDTFVSYSEHDAEWVENFLVKELENSCPPFRLCLHKRDFVPGKWIVDNIIEAIEKSHKTLFVLSKHFVQSEWCKYELDFSHLRLFDEKNDSAILIVLEPIQKETLPKRFCRLRKLMNTKTYLEWPDNEDEQCLFWFNLKVALKLNTP
ncbi:toll-like receptor 2 [Protopterus annectens]|uniref:toll-like receptor 2 n=1 Tax=Protopterus annectens TaxID=7888 RepID=UPI001CFC2485|nr:toll-like receptor 2 [Protopterus annectens]